MSPHETVREFFPGATDEQCHNALWVCTGFPAFWRIPEDGNTPEDCCRKQLAYAKSISANIDEAIAACDAEFCRAADEAIEAGRIADAQDEMDAQENADR